MEKIYSSYCLRANIKKAADKAIVDGIFTGVNDFSGLIELALVELLKTKGIILEA